MICSFWRRNVCSGLSRHFSQIEDHFESLFLCERREAPEFGA